jgi:hypothetical protein
MKKFLFIFMATFIVISGCVQAESINYFGQSPPGDSAIIFAPGIVSRSDRQEYSFCFSPMGDKCYFTAFGSDDVSKIYFAEYIENSWTKESAVPFSGNQNTELSSVSADGNKIYFSKDGDIWMVERKDDKWGEPKRLPSPINTDYIDAFYNETNNKIVYIYSNRPGINGENLDIWRITSGNDSSLMVENLSPIINSSNLQVTPCIATDESFLIFSQPIDYWFRLFISFKKDNGEWTPPVDMNITGAGINILSQNCPTLSPEGKYLFFNRHDRTESGNVSDIYWISTAVIDNIKNAVLKGTDGVGNKTEHP